MSKVLSVSSFNLILYVAQQKGADYDLLCKKTGISPQDLQNPDNRLPIAQAQKLWKEAIEMTGDEFLPLHIGEMINTISVGILAYVMMHSPILGKALEKLCQYQDIVCDASKTSLIIENGLAHLTISEPSDDIFAPHYAYESTISIYHSAINGMLGENVQLKSVHFDYPAYTDNLSEYHRIFKGAEIIFNSHFTGLVFSEDYLKRPILNANPNLFSLFEIHANEILNSLKPSESLKEKIKKEILHDLKGEEPTLSNIAKKLGIGVRSIQLKLKEEGVTFQQLLDEIRKNLATKHLKEAQLSTTDIAYLLGYSEPSVFFRSFKKWTGQTPTIYRKNYQMVA
ncbi:AraC-like DNA-binding protein [Arcicella aurantiaca]|uniref:AraC-like DNA-binding protein n=1 Tax=Arcicella aurantiaca TaxID=591202 RepID=A0A316EH03_9BACT|nr:AraC family transcriptional regulator [Arcicella aurantiaca]PWK29354.1 AraC-like DNA-binding protein [Arcicella aurantiaca]